MAPNFGVERGATSPLVWSMVVTPFPSISQTDINIHKKTHIDPENQTFFEEMFFQTNFQAQLMAWSSCWEWDKLPWMTFVVSGIH